MSTHVLVEESYVTVLADETVPRIIVALHAFANSVQFKAFMRAGLAHYQAHSRAERPWG